MPTRAFGFEIRDTVTPPRPRPGQAFYDFEGPALAQARHDQKMRELEGRKAALEAELLKARAQLAQRQKPAARQAGGLDSLGAALKDARAHLERLDKLLGRR